MSNLPADVINQALDAIGSDVIIGEPEEGTREAQVCLRAYGQCIRQLLRSAHWDFARKQAPLQLLADATGQTPNVGNQVPWPWTYEYGYPTDCLKMRFIPMNNWMQSSGSPNGNIVPPNSQSPIVAFGPPPINQLRLIPARFVVSTDFNYIGNTSQGDWWNQQGTSPAGTTVVLTNVFNAWGVYTALMVYPNMWDALFREAMVSYLASQIALPLTKDKKLGKALRDDQILIAKNKIMQARITDGNEGWYSVDHVPDWMRTRNSGAWGAGAFGGFGDGGGPGMLGCGWDSCSFSDGSAY
jgi:hypothetical protein